ncbi:MAG: hypothetical protein OEZ36_07600 [Spirochaetota bacterium]|nr:hypothetical protein [Spirochaetota bacterium]
MATIIKAHNKEHGGSEIMEKNQDAKINWLTEHSSRVALLFLESANLLRPNLSDDQRHEALDRISSAILHGIDVSERKSGGTSH